MTRTRRWARGGLLAVMALGACSSSSNDPAQVPSSCSGFVMPNPASSGLPNPASYTTNADGTVTDDVTGLDWEAVVDATGYMLDEGTARCAAKGAGWRLPTRLELVSLVDFTISEPAIDAVFKDTPPGVYWSSSPYYGDVSGDAWYVGFDAGYSDYGIVDQSNLVRCVRPPAPRCFAPRFEAQAGGVVLDRATGLAWQQTLDPGSYSWDDALTYCAGLGAGWRAPSLKEAQTIIDDAMEFPALDATAFPDTPSESFWTSTAKAGGAGAAWYIDVFYGATDSDVTTRLFRVRCVR